MNKMNIFLLILFALFLMYQFAGAISTGLLLYNSKKNQGIYCSTQPPIFLGFFWFFSLAVLAYMAIAYGYDVFHVHHTKFEIIAFNLAIVLWTVAVLGSIFLGIITFKKGNGKCFQMSNFDTILALITLIITIIAFLFIDFVIVKTLINRISNDHSGEDEEAEYAARQRSVYSNYDKSMQRNSPSLMSSSERTQLMREREQDRIYQQDVDKRLKMLKASSKSRSPPKEPRRRKSRYSRSPASPREEMTEFDDVGERYIPDDEPLSLNRDRRKHYDAL